MRPPFICLFLAPFVLLKICPIRIFILLTTMTDFHENRSITTQRETSSNTLNLCVASAVCNYRITGCNVEFQEWWFRFMLA